MNHRSAELLPAPPRLPGSYLVVELTNRCSLACVHCSVSETAHPHHAKTGYLDPAIFDALLDDLEDWGAGFSTLILFWLGEPLLHPHFTRIWRRALRSAALCGTFDKVEVHTNGTHLTPARAQALLNVGAVDQVLHFSLDAATQPTYLRVKGIDRFALVDDHVHGFLTLRAARGASRPRPVLQFIVGSNNVGDVPAFVALWTSRCEALGLDVRCAAGHVPPGDDVVLFFRQLDCPTAEEQQAENAVFRDAMGALGLALPVESDKGLAVAAENLKPCSGFWKSPVVSWKGEVTTCTRDNLLHNAVGELSSARFRDLWWGATMAERRAHVAQGDYGALALCQTCFIPRSLNHTELSSDDVETTARWWQEVSP